MCDVLSVPKTLSNKNVVGQKFYLVKFCLSEALMSKCFKSTEVYRNYSLCEFEANNIDKYRGFVWFYVIKIWSMLISASWGKS